MSTLGGTSRQSLAALRSTLDDKLKGLSSAECVAISTDLFSALKTISTSVGLRRAIIDPARDSAAKADLINDLFGKSISKPTLAILESAASLRWSSPVDIANAIEQLAIEAEATAANAENQLDRVQDELFAFSRILIEHSDLRQALNLSGVEDEYKTSLVESILGKQAAPSTVRLLVQLVNGLGGRSIEIIQDLYIQAVAARRNRLIAIVRTRAALTEAQSEKLSITLSKQVGQPIHLNIQIDPTVIGGISIRFADELVDGTISTRLAEAGRALAV